MQDRPKGHVLDENVDEHDQTKPLKDLSDLTENFPHLFSPRGKDNSTRNKKASRLPR